MKRIFALSTVLFMSIMSITTYAGYDDLLVATAVESDDYLETDVCATAISVANPVENDIELSDIDYDYPDHLDRYGTGGNGTEESLEKYYGKNGYPEYISYVCNVGGESLEVTESGQFVIAWYYEVGLTDMSEENQQAVLDIAAENCYINFVQCQWSYNEREAVYNELIAMGYDNVIMGLNTENVYVYAPGEDVPLYDGIVVLQDEQFATCDGGVAGDTLAMGAATGGMETGVITGAIEKEQDKLPVWLWIGIAAIVMVVGGAVLMLHRPGLSINADGSAQTERADNSVEKRIADSAEAPSPDLKERIIDKIK